MAAATFTMRSCWKQVFTLDIIPGVGIQKWNISFLVSETVFIFLICSRPCLLFGRALEAMRDTAAKGGRILFVGTKRAAADKIAETAKACGQYYVNHRWLGGMLTNWATVSQSIKRLRDLEGRLSSDEVSQLGKKEILQLTRERDKLELTLGGLKKWVACLICCLF